MKKKVTKAQVFEVVGRFVGSVAISLIAVLVFFWVIDLEISGGWKLLWTIVITIVSIWLMNLFMKGGNATMSLVVMLVIVFIAKNFTMPQNPPLRHPHWWEAYSEHRSISRFEGICLKDNQEFQQLLQQAVANNRLPISLVESLISTESSWDQSAVSNTGCKGLMQLSKRAAREEGLVVNLIRDDRENPEMNIRAGCSYLAKMLKKADGNVALALAYYSVGPNASEDKIQKAINGYADSIITEISVPNQLLGF